MADDPKPGPQPEEQPKSVPPVPPVVPIPPDIEVGGRNGPEPTRYGD